MHTFHFSQEKKIALKNESIAIKKNFQTITLTIYSFLFFSIMQNIYKEITRNRPFSSFLFKDLFPKYITVKPIKQPSFVAQADNRNNQLLRELVHLTFNLDT